MYLSLVSFVVKKKQQKVATPSSVTRSVGSVEEFRRKTHAGSGCGSGRLRSHTETRARGKKGYCLTLQYPFKPERTPPTVSNVNPPRPSKTRPTRIRCLVELLNPGNISKKNVICEHTHILPAMTKHPWEQIGYC